MKVLFVGDPHVTVGEIGDCAHLIAHVHRVATKESPDRIVFLGDQYHNHAVMNVHVMSFWCQSFEFLRKWPIFCLVGNHDYPGFTSTNHSMLAHRHDVTVIDRPTADGGVLYVQYVGDADEFVEICNRYPECNTVVCHETFDGAQFDNGIFAPKGVKAEKIPQSTVISGHIHTPQQFGKVQYLGSPRWRTLSDANKDRWIWIVEHDEEGKISSTKQFSTNEVCRQIRHLVDTPEKPAETVLDPRHSWRIDIVGPEEWVTERKPLFTRPGVRVRTVTTRAKSHKVRESVGIYKALFEYLKSAVPKYGTDPQLLENTIRTELGVMNGHHQP